MIGQKSVGNTLCELSMHTLRRTRRTEVTLTFMGALSDKVHRSGVFKHEWGFLSLGVVLCRRGPWVLLAVEAVCRVLLQMEGLAVHVLVI